MLCIVTARSEVELRKKTMFLKEAERLFLLQHAKCSYLKYSDRCSKLFHAIVRRNSKRNHILTMLREDGSMTNSLGQVADEFVRYFEGLLGTAKACEPFDSSVLSAGPRISMEQAASLSSCISSQEIKSALFSIGEDKSPRPDGFSFCFFKRSWHILGDQFTEAVHDFFTSGRSVAENVHLAQELLQKYSKKGISPHCLIKVDLRKAYDSISWSFLRQILEGKKGLRHGNPLSPFLFVLCIKYLSRFLKAAMVNSKFNFHPKCGGLKDLRRWNLALLVKVLWNIHGKKDSLWVCWTHHQYLVSSSVWEWAARKDDSPLIKKLLAIRDALCIEAGSNCKCCGC
ncbi:uncharacterized protein LOC127790918 [Diospyros lotus]|uniref:uncharacterized protein LOC127790918 n=1 Tax=Diospyros lotus TaxID=55363 RepID=UPI0022559BEE|nr:uncharacterized protein LOC127790918 [Diospyros lotus]